MPKTDLAYFAGFFDGEGCIIIGTKNCTWNKNHLKTYYLTVSAGSTNHWILELLRFQFEGKVYLRKPQELSRKPFWQWNVQNRQALRFLKTIAPYLKLKKAEADIAIQWQEKRHMGKHYNEGERAIAEAQKILLESLKKRSD